MAKKIIISSDNALVNAAIYGIVNKAFNAYFHEPSDCQTKLFIDGWDAERICIPALEAVINSVISPKMYSVITENIEEPNEEE